MRQPPLESDPPAGRRPRLGRATDDGRRRRYDRQDHYRRTDPGHFWRKRPLRNAGEPPRAGTSSRRLLQRFGVGRGRRPGRFCPGFRHRRLGARAGQLLRAVRHPAHPRAHPVAGYDAAGAYLRHRRLVRPRRRHFRPRGGGNAAAGGGRRAGTAPPAGYRRGRPGTGRTGAAGSPARSAGRRGRPLCVGDHGTAVPRRPGGVVGTPADTTEPGSLGNHPRLA